MARRLRQFGSGDIASLYTGIGPHRDLIGQAPAAARALAGAGVAGARLACSPTCAGAAAWCPPRSPATCAAAGPALERDLAVSVNGRIEAVGRSFHLAGDPVEHFALMVPESSLREGRNEVALFEVVAGRLRRL